MCAWRANVCYLRESLASKLRAHGEGCNMTQQGRRDGRPVCYATADCVNGYRCTVVVRGVVYRGLVAPGDPTGECDLLFICLTLLPAPKVQVAPG